MQREQLLGARHDTVATGRASLLVDDGQRLLALNELFLGVRTHQSARYRIIYMAREERQSSSGLIIATGTGATGWARSIRRERHSQLAMPAPADHRLAFFVREAFPSVATGTSLTEGTVARETPLRIVTAGDRRFGVIDRR